MNELFIILTHVNTHPSHFGLMSQFKHLNIYIHIYIYNYIEHLQEKNHDSFDIVCYIVNRTQESHNHQLPRNDINHKNVLECCHARSIDWAAETLPRPIDGIIIKIKLFIQHSLSLIA